MFCACTVSFSVLSVATCPSAFRRLACTSTLLDAADVTGGDVGVGVWVWVWVEECEGVGAEADCARAGESCLDTGTARGSVGLGASAGVSVRGGVDSGSWNVTIGRAWVVGVGVEVVVGAEVVEEGVARGVVVLVMGVLGAVVTSSAFTPSTSLAFRSDFSASDLCPTGPPAKNLAFSFCLITCSGAAFAHTSFKSVILSLTMTLWIWNLSSPSTVGGESFA